MSASIEYPNLLSRLIARRRFENQFIVVPPPPARLVRFLQFCERRLWRVSTENIRVDRPIFLLGIHRSGTTMLQDILCSLPETAYITNVMNGFMAAPCAAEMIRRRFRLDARGERFLADGVIVDGGSPNEGVAFWERWLGEEPDAWLDEHAPPPSAMPIETIREEIRRIMWCFRPDGTRFFSKNPRLVAHAETLSELFPDAKFIHIIRDPRDCAGSLVKLYGLCQDQLQRIRARGNPTGLPRGPYMPYPRLPNLRHYVHEFGPQDLRTMAHLWNDAVESVRKAGSRMACYYEVRYEDILDSPCDQVEKILEFCDLPGRVRDQPKLQEKLRQVSRRPTNYPNAGLVEDICGELMRDCGYSPHRSVAAPV